LHAIPSQHADEFFVEHAPGMTLGVLQVECSLLTLGAERAVAEKVQDVVALAHAERLFVCVVPHRRLLRLFRSGKAELDLATKIIATANLRL
jgi:hypothetical protein